MAKVGVASAIQMSVALAQVRDVFKGLETGDGAEFFNHVADDVDAGLSLDHRLS